jgi:D-serine deaminase-like pyridoxal phosphate-dependent protein
VLVLTRSGATTRSAGGAAKARIYLHDDTTTSPRPRRRAKAGTTIDVLVEIDVGGRRCGCSGTCRRIAERVASCAAFWARRLPHGRSTCARPRAPAADRARHRAGQETLRGLEAAGLSAATVGGGGTGTYENEAASRVYNELQTGSYIFMDADYARNKRADGGPFDAYEHALFVTATVMSAPVPERAILDAGLKALAVDSGMPMPWKLPGALYHRPSDEHGMLDLSASAVKPKRGDKVLLVPGHCDPTVNLHDWYVGIRGLGGEGARVECLWPVAARGALF